MDHETWVGLFVIALAENHGWGPDDMREAYDWSAEYQALVIDSGWREWSDPSTGYQNGGAAEAAAWLVSQYD